MAFDNDILTLKFVWICISQKVYSYFIIISRLKERDVILQKMHSAESHYKTQVEKLEHDLEDQRAKNNVSNKKILKLKKTQLTKVVLPLGQNSSVQNLLNFQ